MRIVTFEDLPAALDRERVALQFAAFSGMLGRRAIGRFRARHYLLSDYIGLFALEGGRLLGQALVYHLPLHGRAGPMTVAGIASVTSRSDSGRRGIARAILSEVHRREREAGLPYALLWTNRSWYAHHLYETLGYRDVFVPPLAVRRAAPGRAPERGSAFRKATASDLARMEAWHTEFVTGRTGFAPRPAGFLVAEQAAGTLGLDRLVVYRRAGKARGYASVARHPGGLSCDELVGPPEELPGMLRDLERRATGGVFAVGYTPALDLTEVLRSRGYLLRRRASWYTLMACPLEGPRSPRELAVELTVDRPSFVCMGLDRF